MPHMLAPHRGRLAGRPFECSAAMRFTLKSFLGTVAWEFIVLSGT
jgi:hypothetical protein